MVSVDLGKKGRAPVLGAPRWHTRPLGDSRLELTITGNLHGQWAIDLTARLARLELSIERGHARRDPFGYWISRFELVVPVARDYSGIHDAEWLSDSVPSAAAVQLERHTFRYSDDHDGSIRLDIVEAPDCVGFLTTLLRRLGDRGLKPVELLLETAHGRVYDSIWLKEVQERTPSEETCRDIRRHLDQYVRG